MTTLPPTVHLALGACLLQGEDELDFTLDGVFALSWQRTYASHHARCSVLGSGWTLPLSFTLERGAEKLFFIDLQGRRTQFPLLDIGESFYSRFEHTTLRRCARERYELITPDGVRLLFAPIIGAANTATLPLQSVLDANGNGWYLHYNGQTHPQALEGTDGWRIGFVYDDSFDTPRLIEVRDVSSTSADSVLPDGLPSSRLLVAYRYNAAGDLSEVLDGTGLSCRSFAYQSHQLIEQRHADGRVMRYQWDRLEPEGRILAMQSESGRRWQFDYDSTERRLHITETAHNGLTRSSTHWFNKDQHPIAIEDAEGGRTVMARNAYGDVIRQTDPAGHTTTYAYDSLSRLSKVTLPDGSVQETLWHPELHQPLTHTDALGQSTHYHYDDRGNLLSVTDASGYLTAYTYDHRGLPTAITDALGKTKQLEYNRRGQLIAYTDCSDQRTEFSWDEAGNLLSVTDALGQVTRYEYERINRQQRLTCQRLPDGSVERFAYDPAGRLIAHADPLGQQTRWQLDAEGNPTARTNALGHSLRYQHDGFNRLTCLTNENGAPYHFAWDNLDRLKAEQGFDGRRIDYRYDPAGHLLEMADGLPQGAAWMAPSPSAIRTHYQRDALGRLRERLAHKPGQHPQRARYDYDAAGQLTLARNSDARVQLLYTATGQIAREILSTRLKQRSTLTHRYDELGNRISTTLPDGRTVNTLTYGSGHVHQLNIDGEVICDFERDNLHREIERSQGQLTSRYRLDALGRLLESQTQTKGQPPHNTTHGQQIARRYHYDAAGQLSSIDDSRIGLTRYQYDAIGRLTQALARHGAERFAFDPAHNLVDAQTSRTGQPNAQPQTDDQWAEYVRAHVNDPDFNPLQSNPPVEYATPEQWQQTDNRLKVWQEHRYQYDAWGNCTRKHSGKRQVQHYEWDAEHQLIAVQTENPNQQEGSTEHWRYAYDPFGRRIAKWQHNPARTNGKAQLPPSDAFTHFAWDGNRLLAEYTQKQNQAQHKLYLYEPDSFVPLAQVESEWDQEDDTLVPDLLNSTYNDPALNQMIQEARNAPFIWHAHILPLHKRLRKQMGLKDPKPRKPALTSCVLYYHTDHLGTPRELTDTNGNIVWAATYKAWGATQRIDHPPILHTVQDGNTVQEQWIEQNRYDRPSQNLRFQGQYLDQETGLHYNRFRYYDPDIGRFISQDPIGLFGGDNLYQYAPNPTEWIDPWGLTKKKRCASLKTKKGRVKEAGLPTKGKIRFVPDKRYDPQMPLPKGKNDGYVDRFGNEWVKGPSRTKGQPYEWDVQLSTQGKSKLGWATRDKSHLNVSIDGRITHK